MKEKCIIVNSLDVISLVDALLITESELCVTQTFYASLKFPDLT